MGKKGKVGKNRQDKFYHLAKEQGFRSRASFKLVQLNKRHDFLSSASRGVLDLCAAPGGWMQVARKHMPLHAPCIGIDLVPIRPVHGCTGLVGDITSDETRGNLRRALRAEGRQGAEEKVDVVLNDGSPNMGKAWLQDAYTQSELTLAALKLAVEFLAPGGVFVTKVFRSNDYNSLLFVMHQLFGRVNATKPSASRAESAEIYVMCLGFKAPKAVDPRLLNPKFVFKDMHAASAAVDEAKPDLYVNTVMKEMKKRKRHRGGYADGELTLFHQVSVLQYCRSPRPVAMMVESSQFSFEPRIMVADGVSEVRAKAVARLLAGLPETTAEVLSCCEDLKVLARRDFKLLLKWRGKARGALLEANLLEEEPKEETDAVEKAPDSDMEDKQPVQDDAKMKDGNDSTDGEKDLNDEITKARSDASAKEKRKKRKANKLRNAIQRKIDMKIILPEEGGEAGNDGPQGLFSINTALRAQKHGVPVTDVPIDDPHDADDEENGDGENDAEMQRLPYRVGDVDKAWKEGNADIEEDLDRWYKVYLSRKKRDKNGVLLAESKERKRITKRRALREAYEKGKDGDADDAQDDGDNPKLVVDSDASTTDGEDSGREMHLSGNAAQSREAALWFSQPMFQGMTGLSSDDSDGAETDEDARRTQKKLRRRVELEAEDEDAELTGEENFHAAAKREARKMVDDKQKQKEEDGDDFDVVPAQKDSFSDEEEDKDGADSDSSFHSSDYDSDEKAEMVAIGRRMRQSKTEASDVLDEAYNRYTFDDPFDLPRWFADPDPTYRKRQAPVTKEQVAEMKDYIKSLQAAPTKKEAEAKARRRARATKKVEAMKAKANSIAEQGDVPASSRMKAIEDLYKQAMKSGKSGKKNKKKVYQVVTPSGKMPVGKNAGRGRKAMRGTSTTLVDKRLKADKRGMAKANAKIKKAGKRK